MPSRFLSLPIHSVYQQSALIFPQSLRTLEAAPLYCASVASYRGLGNISPQQGHWFAMIGIDGLGRRDWRLMQHLFHSPFAEDLIKYT